MNETFDLSKLGPNEFANIVNYLVLEVLGRGNTGFGPGADGGRDGYFEGEAPYPSTTDRWKGSWYIQCKFHAPHLSKDSQKWLREQVSAEIAAFDSDPSDRTWPNNWIIATNIDPSGKPETGSFDAIKRQVKKSRGGRKTKVAVWGGRKIIDLLIAYPAAAKYYAHFLTPGHIIALLYADLSDQRATVEEIIRYFIATLFSDNQHTKLDQAGSSSDVRPGVHELFIDLPFSVENRTRGNAVLSALTGAAAQPQKYSMRKEYPESWRAWSKRAERARVALIKGGPGQGKSTVAQYLCQIHRAYFILSEDGPNVTDRAREVANAVHVAAQSANLWPTSGRIPIQIELKEFVHWYSRRADEHPTTILNYIAETIGKKIGSSVQAKTIKRALSHRAWLLVFDGLDEVPNDFKDSVAQEVISFLNDLLIEIDADVFSICTSRPQGYSGQFDGLEGPVIDLAQLDAPTALKCARPVLRYGRPPDEADASYAILETAIRSPNVKELMTTPLQSHIMAVVVRDGGRPPEKRWNLFDSFYLVMKKRESLKNFQNPRIAKLLREEDRLLKSVHMRLGFVLHARAERSEGAQTMLSKDEFRQLVRDVVSQLGDHEIDETVAGVMEAMTERLVLVSTPESGQTVRFDIRQLQEFFAAEFLYAAVDVKELESRIQVIGGDAHWREVLHFLISALIENERTAELAVAVQVLRGLNEGDGSLANVLFYRRMARAGLMAGRLLVEGVIEQDQRDRNQLRPLFDPLCGLIDIDKLTNLTKIGPEKSKQWLIRLFIETITTLNTRENVGAFFVLGWILPTDPIVSKTVLTAFRNLPVRLQEIVVQRWSPHRELEYRWRQANLGDREQELSQWAVEACVDILGSERWNCYQSDTLEVLLRICGTHSGKFEDACRSIGVDPEAASALSKILEMRNWRGPRVQERSSETFDCGLLTAHRYNADWMSGKVPAELSGFSAQASVKSAGGFFRLLLTCAWWAQERSNAALDAVVAEAELAGADLLGAIPSALLALVPVPGPHALVPYSVEHIKKRGSVNIDVWLKTLADDGFYFPCADLLVVPSKEPATERWELLARRLPRLAIDAALSPKRLRWGGEPQFVTELKAAMEACPVAVGECILGWGTIRERDPSLLSAMIEKVAALSSASWRFGVRNTFSVEPFEIAVPEDQALLRVLAPALVELFTGPTRDSHIFMEPEDTSLSITETLSAYCLNRDELREISLTRNIDSSIRAGALALYWLSLRDDDVVDGVNGVSIDLTLERTLYAEVVSPFNEEWLTRALVNGILARYPETNVGAVTFVTYLMERCLDGSGPREAVINLVEMWRERSSAPVHASQALERWLGYQFEIPSYARFSS